MNHSHQRQNQHLNGEKSSSKEGAKERSDLATLRALFLVTAISCGAISCGWQIAGYMSLTRINSHKLNSTLTNVDFN